jgi:hypothetical protein
MCPEVLTLVNFTSGVFRSEKEMELYQFRWSQVRDKYLPLLREQGLVRYAGMKIWNKHGKTQMGWLFEYSDPEAYKRCQSIFKEIEADMGDLELQLTAYRGVVIEDYDWKS